MKSRACIGGAEDAPQAGERLALVRQLSSGTCVALNGCASPVVMKEQRATISPSRLEWAGRSGVFELFLGKSASLWSEGGGVQVACSLTRQRGVMLTKL